MPRRPHLPASEVLEGYVEYKKEEWKEESPFWLLWENNIKPILDFLWGADLKVEDFRDPPEIVVEGIERGQGVLGVAFSDIARFFREATEDIGYLVLFLIFVLFGSLFLSEKAMFYLLALLLLGILVVNADKIGRALEWLQR